jgi:hypothetical protein
MDARIFRVDHKGDLLRSDIVPLSLGMPGGFGSWPFLDDSNIPELYDHQQSYDALFKVWGDPLPLNQFLNLLDLNRKAPITRLSQPLLVS